MTQKLRFKVLTASFIFASAVAVAQTPAEPAKTAAPASQDDEFARKKAETKLQEVIPTDSLPASELAKRAEAWIKAESDKYKKSGGTTTGTKVECIASFPVKPKELNPEVNYTGKVTMKVMIECKESKYRYTVYEIKHISKSGNTNGGSVDNPVPDCGSMAMNDIVWKKLRGEMLRGAAQVVADLKVGMNTVPVEKKDDEW